MLPLHISVYQEIASRSLHTARLPCYDAASGRRDADVIRKKINALLNRMSEEQLKRVYELIKYIYIYR